MLRNKTCPIIPFVELGEFYSVELGKVGFTPLSYDNSLYMDALQDSIFLQEDFLEMYPDLKLCNEDLLCTDDDCFEFFSSTIKKGITV